MLVWSHKLKAWRDYLAFQGPGVGANQAPGHGGGGGGGGEKKKKEEELKKKKKKKKTKETKYYKLQKLWRKE